MIGLAAIAAGLLYILFSGIVIRIRDKWGRETVIKPPPGSSVIVEEDGKQVAQVPSPDKEAKPSPEPPPAQPLTIGKPIQLPTPVPLKLKAEPLQIEAEEPIGGLVARPAKIPGLASWTIETRGHRGQIKGLACSPDGKLFASAGSDTSIRLWEPSTGRLVRVIAGGSNGPLAWSPDGAVLAAGWKKEVRLWNPNSGQRVRTFVGQGRVSSLAWRPDGTLLAAAYQVPGSRIDLWDVNSGKLRNTLGLGREGWHVSAIAWLPDGRRLLSCTADGNLLLYDVDKDKPLHTAFTNSPLLAVAPGGNTVVTFGNDRAQVWKIEADRLSKVLTLDAGGTYCRVVFLSKRGAVATFDEVRPLELRDPSTWKVVSIGGRLLPNVAAPSADERLLLAGGYGGGLSATEVESSEVRWQYSGTHFAVGRVKWSPDGKTLVVSYGTQGDCAILGNLA
jgi:WD40 repeat protein